jgi:serine/threonine protein kinase
MNSSYKVIRTLGKGTFGTTYLVEKEGSTDGKKYVLKKIQMAVSKVVDMFSEINVLKKIAKYGCNRRLLCYHESFVNPNDQTINIVTDAFDDAITLAQFIHVLQEDRRYLNTRDLLTITNSLFEGLAYLHKIGIAHGDIKPENILINQKLETQLIDFGVSCSKHCRSSGTILFASPEIIRNMGSRKNISTETLQTADVFSMGLVCFLLANLEFPFSITENNPYAYDLGTGSSSGSSSIGSSDLSEMSEASSDSVQSDGLVRSTHSTHSAPLSSLMNKDIISEIYKDNKRGLREVAGNNELSMMITLYEFYQHLGRNIFSFYHHNKTNVDIKINQLIESMLIISTKAKGSRPSARRLLSNLRKIINEFNSENNRLQITVTPLTPSMLIESPVKEK